jgi:hypothetical protein
MLYVVGATLRIETTGARGDAMPESEVPALDAESR